MIYLSLIWCVMCVGLHLFFVDNTFSTALPVFSMKFRN